MPSIRIVTAGAVALFLCGATAGGADAQTATNQAPGTPLQLLQMLTIGTQPSKIKPKSHAKSPGSSVAEKPRHSAVAMRKTPRLPVQAATVAPPEGIWASVDPAAPTSVAAAAAQPTTAPAEPDPSEIVVAGQTVQVAAADEVNEIDHAADDAGTPSSAAPATDLAASPAAMSEIPPAPKSDFKAPAAAPARPVEVGSASWIVQVLAALGGAVAAGSAAWFLMGSAPQRTYG